MLRRGLLMARRRVSISSCVAASLILCLTAVGCGSGTGGQEAEAGPTSSESVEPPPVSPAARRPATDCSSATTPATQSGVTQGVSASTTTDATGTSLLLKNTGQLALVVIPVGTTRLQPAPEANPSDLASQLALDALASTFLPSEVPGLPAGVPADQVFVVPPDWAVCAVTGRLDTSARVQFLTDKASTAKYALVKQLSDDAVDLLTPPRLKNQQALRACAQGMDRLLIEQPQLNGFDLYATAVRTGTSCQSSYTALLGNSEPQAAQRTESRLLGLLKKSPTLIENTRLITALVT